MYPGHQQLTKMESFAVKINGFRRQLLLQISQPQMFAEVLDMSLGDVDENSFCKKLRLFQAKCLL